MRNGSPHVHVGGGTPTGIETQRVQTRVGGTPTGPSAFQLTMFGFLLRTASKIPGSMVAPMSNSLLIILAAAVSTAPGCWKITRNGRGSCWKPVRAPHQLSLRSNNWV